MDIDVERWVAAGLWPALFAALAVFAWLSIVAHRLEKAKGLADLGREARKLREGQEKLKAAGKPAPHLARALGVEAEIRALLRRSGLEGGPAARR